MKISETSLKDVLLFEPTVFGDERGFFLESFNQRQWQEMTGLDNCFVQDNHSRSSRGVLRGLHYQVQQTQGKLIRVVLGEIFDVAVDLRRTSPSCGQWFGCRLSAQAHRQLWVPEGFAHGFLVLSDWAEVLYKTTDYYAPEHERTLAWDDPTIGIDWPIVEEPILSAKDHHGSAFHDAELLP